MIDSELISVCSSPMNETMIIGIIDPITRIPTLISIKDLIRIIQLVQSNVIMLNNVNT